MENSVMLEEISPEYAAALLKSLSGNLEAGNVEPVGFYIDIEKEETSANIYKEGGLRKLTFTYRRKNF